MAAIPEYLLREVWKDHAHFLKPELRLHDGSQVNILLPGEENEHRGGPDFLKARIAIDDVAISGDVELHITPEHWHAHNHNADDRYSNVMLHVVLEQEEEGEHAHAPNIPTLVLRDNLAFDHRELWEELFKRVYDRSPELPCFPHNLRVPIRFKRKVIEKFGEARLEELIDRATEGHDASEAQLLERTYQLTMDALGYSQNRTPFRELSSILPLSRLRYVYDTFGTSAEEKRLFYEALYFGVAGLLPQPSVDFDRVANEYIVDLQAKWKALELSLRLPEILTETDWAFFRIRPLNTPYRRLALAALLAVRYFGRETWSMSDEFVVQGPVADIGMSPFWEERTSFGQPLSSALALLGDERASAVWLNVVLPVRIAHLRSTPETGKRRALEQEIRKAWGGARTKSSAKYLNAFTQELLEGENVISVRTEQGALTLKRNFCDTGRCYECPIGHRLAEQGWKPQGKS